MEEGNTLFSKPTLSPGEWAEYKEAFATHTKAGYKKVLTQTAFSTGCPHVCYTRYVYKNLVTKADEGAIVQRLKEVQ